MVTTGSLELTGHPLSLSSCVQTRKKSTKINFLGPETVGQGGGLPRKGVVVEKFVPSLESLSSLGLEGRNLGMSREFCWDVLDPRGLSKSLCKKKFARIFRSPCVHGNRSA